MGQAEELLKRLRIEQEQHTVAAATGYFDFKYQVKRPKTAAQLEALVEELFNRLGGCFRIIYTGGRQIVSKTKARDVLGHERTITNNKFIPGTTKAGTADLLGVYKGRSIAIEIKFSKGDRQSEAQREFQRDWEIAGGEYFIVKNLNDLIDII